MSSMRRVRPAWALVSAASGVVVVASISGSAATGMGWWNWQSNDRKTLVVDGKIASRYGVRWSIDRGGVSYLHQQDIPALSGNPMPGNFFQVRPPSAWMPLASIATGRREIIVPFWAVGVMGVLGCVAAWRRARRAALGHCGKCGYDLVGLAAGVCPECGASSDGRRTSDGAEPEQRGTLAACPPLPPTARTS